MFSNVIKYSGVHAKVCALRKQLLTYNDFKKLAQAKDVKSFAEALGENPSYKEAVAEAVEYGANRIAIERSLLKSLYRDYAALYSFVTDQNERRYLEVVFFEYAVDMIKKLLRRIFDNRDIHNMIPKYASFMSRHMGLDVERLESSQTLEELLQNVKGTEIYEVLQKLDKETATLFDYETQLDFYRFTKAHNVLEQHIGKKSKDALRRLKGTEIDLLNIMWIYRARHYYEISKDRIFTYLIPLHYMLTKELVKQLVQAKDRQEFTEILKKSHYRNVFNNFAIDGIEKDFVTYMDKQYDNERKRNPYSLAGIVTYLYFKGQEIKNLTTLLECVRYGRSPEYSLERLRIGHMGRGLQNL